MSNLLDEILKKNSAKHNVDYKLIKKIMELQITHSNSNAKEQHNRQNLISALLKEELK